MYKNRLKELMLERNISNHMLARETTISRQAITKIKNNPFHDISINVLTELLEYFDISFDDFGTIYTREQCLQTLLPDKGFNHKNLDLLESLFSENLCISCKYQPYSSEQCLNIWSKGYYKKFSFSGNMRINTSLYGLTFEITDFDLYRISKNFTFDTFYEFYENFIIQLENYALNLGFTQIVININSYTDKDLDTRLEPRIVNSKDLKFLVSNYKYSNRENELIKMAIIKHLGYIEYCYNDVLQKRKFEKERINTYLDSLRHLTFFEKEKKRISMFSEKNLHSNHNTKKFIKQINSEFIPKEKLEKDVKRQWGW
ncbi:helix-turn-helix domain-containing protein [Listeria seeligeri]|uniref:helix-turn-helix domain-containing protein n=2 Tax=Listeria seeligeri TaxID=1640 RepID=UPI0001C4E455|nr:helix-turn-helix transcriptional regulator [Listeria seeligeri]MBM5609779.1 XRE family transcriptional regulator [Listeria seeligeri]CBH26828.1 DNA-binding domain [Listeria seeligeri serovar 1/2b str. SLCC3954]